MSYYTVLVHWVPDQYRTTWHPTQQHGPFSTLTRGSFDTVEQAIEWGRKHLYGTPFTVKHVDTSKDDELTRLLETFAYHVSELMSAPPGKRTFGLAYNGHAIHARVRIGSCSHDARLKEPMYRTGADADVWDQVWIDGEWYGNRCGGRNEYARRLAVLLNGGDIQLAEEE